MTTHSPSSFRGIAPLALVTALVTALVLSGAGPARAAAAATPAAPDAAKAASRLFGGMVAEAVHLTATVEQIDYETRAVTLKGAQGPVRTIVVGRDVQRLSEIHPGDTVEFIYAESVTVLTSSAAAAPESHEVVEVDRATRHEKPGASRVTTTTVSATVTAVDPKARTVTLKGPQRTLTINVDPAAEHFDQVKVGDSVSLEITQAVAAAVTKSSPNK